VKPEKTNWSSAAATVAIARTNRRGRRRNGMNDARFILVIAGSFLWLGSGNYSISMPD
jgi:hypothetical protein